jgi:hypothetical protein
VQERGGEGNIECRIKVWGGVLEINFLLKKKNYFTRLCHCPVSPLPSPPLHVSSQVPITAQSRRAYLEPPAV